MGSIQEAGDLRGVRVVRVAFSGSCPTSAVFVQHGEFPQRHGRIPAEIAEVPAGRPRIALRQFRTGRVALLQHRRA